MSDPLQVTTPDPLSDKIEDEEDSVSAGVEPKNNDLSEIFTDAVGGKDTAGINFFDSFQQNSHADASVKDNSAESTNTAMKSSDVHASVNTVKTQSNDTSGMGHAWLPTEITRQVLIAAKQKVSYGDVLADVHTVPPVIVNDPQGDPVKELLVKYVGEQAANSRDTLTIENVTHDMAGLQKLIEAECLRSAVDLTGTLLLMAGQGTDRGNQTTMHTPHTLQLWGIRFYLLVSLNLYSHVETELSCFGNLDKPDLYYDFYPDSYGGKLGCMVPFSMRVLHAELPQYLGKTQESLDRLYYIYAVVGKIVTNLKSGLSPDGNIVQPELCDVNKALKLWNNRKKNILYSIGNTLLSIKDYFSATEVFEQLLEIEESVDSHSALLNGIGRIHLQMGDLDSAERYFHQSETAYDESNVKHKSQQAVNKGFIELAKNNFTDAAKSFQAAVENDGENALAINNLVVCLLYTGKLKEALVHLETLVHKNPEHYLQQGILFNLCTLYELESSFAMQKKQKLLQLVTQYKGNGFNTSCLKIV